MNSKDRVLLVTGASRGIGAATALLAASRGYAVCVNFIGNEVQAQKIVQQIQSDGGKALAVQADVSDPEAVRRLFDQVEDNLGRLDGLVNNAGISGPRSKLSEMSHEDVQRVLAVNLLGSFYCAQEAVKRMARSSGGNGGGIVNLSSQAAISGGFNISPYAASKAAINNFTVALSKEVGGEGIRVNAVSPGIIATDQNDPSESGLRDKIAREVPLGRAGTPLEVAEVILWLLSEKASYINGSVIPISGGR